MKRAVECTESDSYIELYNILHLPCQSKLAVEVGSSNNKNLKNRQNFPKNRQNCQKKENLQHLHLSHLHLTITKVTKTMTRTMKTLKNMMLMTWWTNRKNGNVFFCTYLNSLEVDICEMCAKSRQSVASSHDDEEFVSGNSQMDDPNTYESEEVSEYPDTDPHDQDVQVDKVQCPKCTLLNPVDLKICGICGASLHKSPITQNGAKIRNGVRPQSSASKSSGHSRNHNR